MEGHLHYRLAQSGASVIRGRLGPGGPIRIASAARYAIGAPHPCQRARVTPKGNRRGTGDKLKASGSRITTRRRNCIWYPLSFMRDSPKHPWETSAIETKALFAPLWGTGSHRAWPGPHRWGPGEGWVKWGRPGCDPRWGQAIFHPVDGGDASAKKVDTRRRTSCERWPEAQPPRRRLPLPTLEFALKLNSGRVPVR